MSELNIIIDDFGHKELKKYLMSLKGVKSIEIKNNQYSDIYIKYDSNLITPKIIKMEILLFLDIKIPSILSFNKYPKFKTSNYTIIRNDLCCEYCFKNAIENLFEIEGIETVTSNFTTDYFSNNILEKEKITIYIKYYPNIISTLKMKQIESKLTI